MSGNKDDHYAREGGGGSGVGPLKKEVFSASLIWSNDLTIFLSGRIRNLKKGRIPIRSLHKDSKFMWNQTLNSALTVYSLSKVLSIII